jgi:hypothetical protein
MGHSWLPTTRSSVAIYSFFPCTRRGCSPTHRGLSGEQFGPSERFSAVSDDSDPLILVFHWLLLARVLVGVDDLAVGEVLSGISIIS